MERLRDLVHVKAGWGLRAYLCPIDSIPRVAGVTRAAAAVGLIIALTTCSDGSTEPEDGIDPPATGRVSGVAYYDRDHDGEPTPGEELGNLIFAFVSTTPGTTGTTLTTGSDGSYSVQLLEGDYQVNLPALPDSLESPFPHAVQVVDGQDVTLDIALVVVQAIDDLTLPVSTVVVDSTDVGAAQFGAGNETVTVPQGASAFDALVPGDILVVGVTNATPVGFLGRIESVSAAGGQVTLRTVPATLEEAVGEGSLAVRRRLTPGDLRANPPPAPAGVSLVEASGEFIVAFDQVLFDEDGSPQTAHDQIRVDGTVKFAHASKRSSTRRT